MVKLTEEQKVELEALEAIPDDQIDYSDIPEMTDEEWSKARRGMPYQPDWQDITLRLDQNIIDWFEEHAENPEKAHQDINQALTEHIRRERFPGRKPSREAAD